MWRFQTQYTNDVIADAQKIRFATHWTMTTNLCFAFIAPHLISCVRRQNIRAQFGCLRWGEERGKKHQFKILIIYYLEHLKKARNYRASCFSINEGMKLTLCTDVQTTSNHSFQSFGYCAMHTGFYRWPITLPTFCKFLKHWPHIACPISVWKVLNFFMTDTKVLRAHWINDSSNSEVSVISSDFYKKLLLAQVHRIIGQAISFASNLQYMNDCWVWMRIFAICVQSNSQL